ncbi:unnamed protein product [Prunus armeniaca]|uniref:Uncharacterized protein n=1 Tax=Prunus armeniaca TaxID=36596 RepID=A0A6J5WI05_PRUAR|nr:unnamed protein product [Prunus armeniaca]
MKLLLFSSVACRGDSPRTGTPQVEAAPCHIHLRLYIPRGIASWLLLGWAVEERRMPARRLYKPFTKRRKKLEVTVSQRIFSKLVKLLMACRYCQRRYTK